MKNAPHGSIPIFSPEISAEGVVAVSTAIANGEIGKGAATDLAKAKLRKILRLDVNPHLLNSATAALHTALESIQVEGHQVIVTCQSFIATALAVLYARGKPLFCDVDPRSGNMCPNHLLNLLNNSSPKAVVVVHWGGNIASINEIENACSAFNVPIVYDCSHALSTTFKGESVLNFGAYSVASCQAIKEITCGDGGILCQRGDVYLPVEKYTWFGIERNDRRELQYTGVVGFKYRMNNLAASILAAETDKIINRRDSRAYNASRYNRVVPEGFRVKILADSKPSYWLYSLLLPNRKEFQEFFHSRGIETSHIDLDMRENPVFGEQSDELGGINLFNRQHVAIPVRHNLTHCEVDHIEDTLAQFFSSG